MGMVCAWERSQKILCRLAGTRQDPGTPRVPSKTTSTKLRPVDVTLDLVVALHILGIGALLGGVFTQVRAARAGQAAIVPAMLAGAAAMLVTGVALVGLNEAADHEVNQAKIGVKLAILVVILGIVYVRRGERVPSWLLWTVGLLTAANIFIATTW